MKRCACGSNATHTATMCYHGSDPRNNENIVSICWVCENHMFENTCDRPQYVLIGVHTTAQVAYFYAQFDDSADIDYVMEFEL